MLSKCANPGCSAPFLYLSRGKLFRWDAAGNASVNQHVPAGPDYRTSPPRHLEFFWLCEDCAPHLTLVFERGTGIVTRPLLRAKAAAAGFPPTSP